MKRKLLFIATILATIASQAQVTLAKWTFEKDNKSESTILINNGIDMQIIDISFYGRDKYDGHNSDCSYHGESMKYTGGAPRGYFLFPNISTEGAYTAVNMKFAFKYTALYLFPIKEFRVEANIDGSSTWVSLVKFNPIKNSSWQYFDLPMSNEVLNKSNVSFRIAANTNLDFDGFSAGDTNVSIDNVEVVATTSSTRCDNANGNVPTISLKNKMLIMSNTNIEKIQVFDKLGKMVQSSAYSHNISLQNLTNDIYILKITDDKGNMITQKIFLK